MRVPLGGDDGKPLLTVKVLRSDKVSVCVVRLLPGGLWTGTCQGFTYKGRCRHIAQVRKRYVDDTPAAGDLL